MIKKLTSLFFTLLFCVPAFAAEPPHWEFAGWYGGGAYPGIFPDPSVEGRVYLLSDVAGLWKSEDRGENWRQINKGLAHLDISAIAFSAKDPDILYIGSGRGVHKSVDAGENWRFLASTENILRFRRPEHYRGLCVEGGDGQKIYAGTQGRVYHSENGGESWTALDLGGRLRPKTVIHALSLSNEELFIATGEGLLRHHLPTGETTVVPGTAGPVYDMAWEPGSNTLYVPQGRKICSSDNNGLSWGCSSELPVAGNAELHRLSVTKNKEGNIKILTAWRQGWNGGIFLSPDNGRNWDNISTNLLYDLQKNPTRVWKKGLGPALSVAFDPFEENILFLSEFWGAWRSDDEGASWVEKINGAPNTVGSDIRFTEDNKLLVATMDNGLLASSDGGKNYEPLFPRETWDTRSQGHAWRIWTRAKRIVATHSPWDHKANQVLISEDGGKTFVATQKGLPSRYPRQNTVWEKGYVRAIAADPKNPWRMYLGMDGDDGGGFFYSDDGGWHWKRSFGQPGSLRIYNALAVDPNEPRRIYWGAVGKKGGVYRTENSGWTWKKVFGDGLGIFDLAVAKNGTVYAAGEFRGPVLYASYDKGNSWKKIHKGGSPSGAAEGLALDARHPERVAVSGAQWSGEADGKIHLSFDAGKNWTDVTGDLPRGAGASAMAFSPDGGTLYISRYAGSVYRLQLTPGLFPGTPEENPASSTAPPEKTADKP